MKQVEIFKKYLLLEDRENNLILQDIYNQDKYKISYKNICNIPLKSIAKYLENAFYGWIDSSEFWRIAELLNFKYKVKELFNFKWIEGSINHNIMNYCELKNIEFRYTYQRLELLINNSWCQCDYISKNGLTTIYYI